MATTTTTNGGVVPFARPPSSEEPEPPSDFLQKMYAAAKEIDRQHKADIDACIADKAWQYDDEPSTAMAGPYLAMNRAARRQLVDNMCEPLRSQVLAQMDREEAAESERSREALR